MLLGWTAGVMLGVTGSIPLIGLASAVARYVPTFIVAGVLLGVGLLAANVRGLRSYVPVLDSPNILTAAAAWAGLVLVCLIALVAATTTALAMTLLADVAIVAALATNTCGIRNRLPGFNSRQKPSRALAWAGLLWAVFISLVGAGPPAPLLILLLEWLGVLALVTNIGNIRSQIPALNSEHRPMILLGWVGVACVALAGLAIAVPAGPRAVAASPRLQAPATSVAGGPARPDNRRVDDAAGLSGSSALSATPATAIPGAGTAEEARAAPALALDRTARRSRYKAEIDDELPTSARHESQAAGMRGRGAMAAVSATASPHAGPAVVGDGDSEAVAAPTQTASAVVGRLDQKGERVTIANKAHSPQDLTGWSLRASNGATFRFPHGYVLGPNAAMMVATGPTATNNPPGVLFWTAGRVWSSRSDKIQLLRPDGSVAVELTVDASRQ